MDDSAVRAPAALERLTDDTQRLGFTLASDPRTGAVLRVLAASKPGGRLLELGTGTGVGTAWLLDGMDRDARLLSIDTEAPVQEVARRHLGDDPRVTFQLGDGGAFLEQASAQTFRPDLRRCLAGQVHPPGRGALAADDRRHVSR
ncbi:MAG: hypothetical protein ABI818_04890 [Acidobacteriota bacterium]